TVAVLDTGVDTGHPDLAGKISAAKNFVNDSPMNDRHGHGTHVASIIAGSGAASDGRYARVAPGVDLAIGKAPSHNGRGTESGAASDGRYAGVAAGVDLAIGKVLNDNGQGTESVLLAGMEWAATQTGADVVSMSLGGCCSDGTDLMSQTLNLLSLTTDTLFVV